jgi:hypothetical protein
MTIAISQAKACQIYNIVFAAKPPPYLDGGSEHTPQSAIAFLADAPAWLPITGRAGAEESRRAAARFLRTLADAIEGVQQ